MYATFKFISYKQLTTIMNEFPQILDLKLSTGSNEAKSWRERAGRGVAMGGNGTSPPLFPRTGFGIRPNPTRSW